VVDLEASPCGENPKTLAAGHRVPGGKLLGRGGAGMRVGLTPVLGEMAGSSPVTLWAVPGIRSRAWYAGAIRLVRGVTRNWVPGGRTSCHRGREVLLAIFTLFTVRIHEWGWFFFLLGVIVKLGRLGVVWGGPPV
jgi:hypothetical protein